MDWRDLKWNKYGKEINTLDYNQIDALGNSIRVANRKWKGALEKVASAVDALATSENINGRGAKNVKEYLATVHTEIINSFKVIMAAHADNYVLYKQDYYDSIDGKMHAKILQDEILEIQESIVRKRTQVQDINKTIVRARNNISGKDVISSISSHIQQNGKTQEVN